MPDLSQPGSRYFTIQHLATAVAGLVGVYFAAATDVLEELHPITSLTVWVWSTIFILAGVLGTIARLRRRYRAETYAAEVTAGAIILWALMILVVTRPFGGPLTQVAIWMFGAASMLHGWAVYRRHRLTTNAVIRQETGEALRAFREG